jgi:hypothetical protein
VQWQETLNHWLDSSFFRTFHSKEFSPKTIFKDHSEFVFGIGPWINCCLCNLTCQWTIPKTISKIIASFTSLTISEIIASFSSLTISFLS